MLPKRIYAGTSAEVTYSLSAHSPLNGWNSFVVFRSKKKQTVHRVDSIASGSSYKLKIQSSESANWEADQYGAFIYVAKGVEREVVISSTIQVLPDPTGNAVTSELREELASVNRAIAGVLAGEGVLSYTFETAVGRRSAERMSLEDLRKHRNDVERRLAGEEAEQMGKKNPHGWRKIQSTFNR